MYTHNDCVPKVITSVSSCMIFLHLRLESCPHIGVDFYRHIGKIWLDAVHAATIMLHMYP